MQVLVIDDHELFADGIKYFLLASYEDIRVQTLNTLRATPELEKISTPDLVLLDYRLDGHTGLDLIQDIHSLFPSSRVVFISGEDSKSIVQRCFEAGASGFIPKNLSKEVIHAALELVLLGGSYFPTDVLVSKRGDEKKSLGLTSRQEQVLDLAVKGIANKVIAEELGISDGTVKAHLHNAYKALAVTNRTEAAAYLLNNNRD